MRLPTVSPGPPGGATGGRRVADSGEAVQGGELGFQLHVADESSHGTHTRRSCKRTSATSLVRARLEFSKR
jgi:hypothetical protein